MQQESQFGLLTQQRFLPFFMVQFLGAMNDNVFKNALILLFVFYSAELAVNTNALINVAAGLFILPFFLFSGAAGRFADKYNKAMLIRRLKMAEIVIMTTATYALIQGHYYLLLFILFLMGTQSAFFGPIKYAILPQHLGKKELVGGNAMVEMGTFLAILIGTIVGGLLVGFQSAAIWVSATVLLLASLGYVASRYIPSTAVTNADLNIGWNLFKHTVDTLKLGCRQRNIRLSILAISWFWFLGASYLTQIPNFTKEYLGGNNQVVTLVLACFSIGIAIGSLLCEKLSRRSVELGIVPIGSIGLSVFGIDLYFSVPDIDGALVGAQAFLMREGSLHILMDVVAIGVFGGLFIVPLYAYVQIKSDDRERSQFISAINIVNALFMVFSAITGIVFLGLFDMSIPEYLLAVAILNLFVSAYVYLQVPEFMTRFIIWILSHTVYRVKHIELDNVPENGAAVLVCNHVSYMDALILGGAVQRPVRFVMDSTIFKLPALNWFFRMSQAIPIASQKRDPEVYASAMAKVSEVLREGHVVCIFPEGKLTKDGEMDQFRRGIETIIEKDAVPVVPMALYGLWGSYFSHYGGRALTGRPKRFWSKIVLAVGEPVAPEEVSADDLYQRVFDMHEQVAKKAAK